MHTKLANQAAHAIGWSSKLEIVDTRGGRQLHCQNVACKAFVDHRLLIPFPSYPSSVTLLMMTMSLVWMHMTRNCMMRHAPYAWTDQTTAMGIMRRVAWVSIHHGKLIMRAMA